MSEVSGIIRNEELNSIRPFLVFRRCALSPASFKVLERVAKYLDGKVTPFTQLICTPHTHDANCSGDWVQPEGIHATHTLYTNLQSPLDDCESQTLSNTNIDVYPTSDSFLRNQR
jgi:hypothetical protein